MIVQESYAVCNGCAYRLLVEDAQHPATWPTYTNGTAQRFCSTSCMLSHLSGVLMPKQRKAWPCGLSNREAEVLERVALGHTNKEIGRALHLAESTVKNMLSKAMLKLGVFDRNQAILMADAAGILNLHQLAQRFADTRRAA